MILVAMAFVLLFVIPDSRLIHVVGQEVVHIIGEILVDDDGGTVCAVVSSFRARRRCPENCHPIGCLAFQALYSHHSPTFFTVPSSAT